MTDSTDTGDWVKPIPFVDAVSKPFWYQAYR